MNITLQKFENIDSIQIIIRKRHGWVINENEPNLPSIDFQNIDNLLTKNLDLVQINLDTIINLNNINQSLSNIEKEYLVVGGKIYIITTRYLKKVKAAFKKKFLLKDTKYTPNFKGNYLKSENIVLLEIKNIRYLVRKGSLTTITYNDGSQRCFYQTLKYFDKLLSKELSFIRVRRDCIVNTVYLNNYQINKKTKTGELSIESSTFPISRRNLQSFKKIIPYIKIV